MNIEVALFGWKWWYGRIDGIKYFGWRFWVHCIDARSNVGQQWNHRWKMGNWIGVGGINKMESIKRIQKQVLSKFCANHFLWYFLPSPLLSFPQFSHFQCLTKTPKMGQLFCWLSFLWPSFSRQLLFPSIYFLKWWKWKLNWKMEWPNSRLGDHILYWSKSIRFWLNNLGKCFFIGQMMIKGEWMIGLKGNLLLPILPPAGKEEGEAEIAVSFFNINFWF